MFVGVLNCLAALAMALLVSASPVSAQEAATKALNVQVFSPESWWYG
jgi:hypothetical protein